MGVALLAGAESAHVVFIPPETSLIGQVTSLILAGVVLLCAVFLCLWMPRAYELSRSAKHAEEHGVELKRAIHDLSVFYREARQLTAQKRDLLASLDQDLRTPLTSLMTPLQELRAATNLTPPQQGAVSTILRHARLLLRNVNDLLDLADLDATRLLPMYGRLDAAKLVENICLSFETVLLARQVRLRRSLPQTLMMECDADKLARIVINLLSNAIQFTPSGGSVELHLDDTQDSVILTVQDSGPSIPAPERERIFEPFRRVELRSATSVSLALVKEFAELLGGRVELTGVAPQGNRFVVLLPRAAPYPVEVTDDERVEVNVEALAEPALRELWSFSDDDDHDLDARPRRLLVLALTDAGHAVREALAPLFARSEIAFGNSVQAVANLARPDLVVFEFVAMNDARRAFLKSIASHPDLADAPILYLVTKEMLPNARAVLSARGNDFALSPVVPTDVCLRAQRLLELSDARRTLQGVLNSDERDLRQLAHKALAHHTELRTNADALRLAHEQAEREIQLKKNLLGMISHELRTPMTAMQLQLERLERHAEALPENLRGLVGRLSQSLRRLSDLDESLLTYTRIDAGRLRSTRERFDLRQLTDDTVDAMRVLAKGRDIALTASVDPSIAEVTSDPQLVRLIITNLLQNALKFTKLGQIRLAVKDLDDELCISVSDTGPGIAKEHHARLFAPYAHLDGDAVVPGMGVGLALVREMVTALGGRIELDSEPGRGSTFTVLLPHQGTRARVYALTTVEG